MLSILDVDLNGNFLDLGGNGGPIVVFQGVSQIYLVWAVRPKLGIFELWSRRVWGLALKGPNGVRGKAPENFGSLGLTHFFISNSIFRVNIRVAWQIYVFNVKSYLVVA